MLLQESEITVVGAGMVGLALAIDLLKQGQSVTLIGKSAPDLPHPGNRCVAINMAAKEFLSALGVWERVHDKTSYQHMQVWEKDNFGKLEFHASDTSYPELGFIVVNSVMEQALWDTINDYVAQHPEAKFTYLNDFVKGYQGLQGRHAITTEDGTQVICTFMAIADGTQSKMRQLLNIGVDRIEYNQAAITAVIEVPHGHNHTCYQSFHQAGILAYLPIDDSKTCSIVWSLNNEYVEHVLAYDEATFCKELYACFNGGLGLPKLLSKPTSFVLARQYAQQIHGRNFFILGDAAHAIHPLAGQGVNLGFADAWQLADCIRKYYRHGQGVAMAQLDALARRRKAKAFQVSESMALMKNSFINTNPLLTLGRNMALTIANKVDVIKDQLMNFAFGFHEEKYSLAKYHSENALVTHKERAQKTVEVVTDILSKLKKSPLTRK